MSHPANDQIIDAIMDERETLFVSFSGGRTSGFMCDWLIKNRLQHYDLVFVFANTGLEHEKTYEFVNECDKRMGLNLVWVEAVVNPEHGKGIRHKVVSYETAARSGEPFEAFIAKSGIPNQSYNQCSERLKTFPMESYRKSLGFKRNHPTAIGIRADEIDRVSENASKLGLVYPLVSWRPTTLAEVRDFWDHQDYDLEIPEHYGNCVTCWKKSDRKLWTIAKHAPHYFEFFDRMEANYSKVRAGEKPRYFFRRHRTTQDIMREARGPFTEFKENKPQLQYGLFDVEEDCGSGCEIA